MKSRQNRRPNIQKSSRAASNPAASSRSLERWRPSPRLSRALAYIIIVLAVIAGWFLTPAPVAAGLTILAAVRLWIIRREERQEQTQAQPPGTQSANGTA